MDHLSLRHVVIIDMLIVQGAILEHELRSLVVFVIVIKKRIKASLRVALSAVAMKKRSVEVERFRVGVAIVIITGLVVVLAMFRRKQ